MFEHISKIMEIGNHHTNSIGGVIGVDTYLTKLWAKTQDGNANVIIQQIITGRNLFIFQFIG